MTTTPEQLSQSATAVRAVADSLSPPPAEVTAIAADLYASADELIALLPPPSAPTAILTASSTSIVVGQSIALTWTSTNGASATLDGASVSLSGTQSVSPITDHTYTLVVMGAGGQATATTSVTVTAVPPPPPPSGKGFTHGPLPADGFKLPSLGSPANYYRFKPLLTTGQRLSGTVTIGVEIRGPAIPPADITALPRRLLVDGVPQPSFTIDTTQWADDTHSVSVQITDAQGKTNVANYGKSVVFNNAGLALKKKAGVVVMAGDDLTIVSTARMYGSLAWGRVNVVDPVAYPLTHNNATHPDPTTDADRLRLWTDKVWWVDSLTEISTGLWEYVPIFVKNKLGDYFIKQWNPETDSWSLNPTGGGQSLQGVQLSAQFDGERGICSLSPYATLAASWDAVHDFYGVDLSGRVVGVDITGKVTTIFGPRSVPGQVQTDPDEATVTLAMRLANGEKEFVGDQSGGTLGCCQDIAPCPTDLTHGWVADTGNNRVVNLGFDGKIRSTTTIPGVISVWTSPETQAAGTAWYAVSPAGLWRKPIGQPVVQVASITNAQWVRGDGIKVYVFTNRMGIVEYDPATGTTTQRKADEGMTNQRFVFADVDWAGNIGPRGRIYFMGVIYGSKTMMRYVDSSNWSLIGDYDLKSAKTINRQIYGNWNSLSDPFGHYLWGFAIHRLHSIFLSTGVSEVSWKIWTAHLGTLPVPDPVIPIDGTTDFQLGKHDQYLGLAAIYGFNGGGGRLGYSCDEFRDLKTWAEAQPIMRAALDPLLPAGMSSTMRDNVCRTMFAQRTRKHFQ